MKKVEELKKTVDHALLKNSETAHALNSNLANHPEISGEEYHSCKEYVRLCREKGMETEEEFVDSLLQVIAVMEEKLVRFGIAGGIRCSSPARPRVRAQCQRKPEPSDCVRPLRYG